MGDAASLEETVNQCCSSSGSVEAIESTEDCVARKPELRVFERHPQNHLKFGWVMCSQVCEIR